MNAYARSLGRPVSAKWMNLVEVALTSGLSRRDSSYTTNVIFLRTPIHHRRRTFQTFTAVKRYVPDITVLTWIGTSRLFGCMRL